MSYNINAYDTDIHLAEIYDQNESGQDDVNLIRRLIDNLGKMKILEPFCGTGRILIPMAVEGHTVYGMDQSAGMLYRASKKIHQLPFDLQARINLTQVDVLCEEWPQDFDLVILGGNCFYELALPEEQERCIQQAFRSLKPGGHLFVDNNHMEGQLAKSWQNTGLIGPSLSGKCSDGTVVEQSRETIWFDAPCRLARFRRRTRVEFPDGNSIEQEYIQQKHPVSKGEVQGWLEKQGFMIEGVYGDHEGLPYAEISPRAIFWARRS